MMRDLNVTLPIVMPHRDLSFPRTKSLNLAGDISPRNILPSITHHGSKWCQAIHRKTSRAYDERKRNNIDETSAENFTARRLVERAVKQAKRSKEINVARLCKTDPKGFYSYINERRIVRDNVGPLKTPTGQIVTTDNDMANTLNTYFSSVFTHEQLNNIPQLPRYVGNTLDTFIFTLEDVQEKLNHLNLHKSIVWR